MIFVCARCKFIFNRTEKPDTCPDCGCELVREANQKEQAEYGMFRTINVVAHSELK